MSYQAIDAHVHFWEYNKKRDAWMSSMKILQQNYLPENAVLTFKRNEVEGCVAVQADQSELETHFLVELAKTHPIIKGVVGWLDLQAENVTDRLHYFSQYPVIKGWRHVAQAEPDDFLSGAKFQRGIAALEGTGYTYDILIYPKQLPAAIKLVEKFPGQPFILDHCAKPEIRDKKMEPWKENIQTLATLPNVCCKVSGLFTEADWSNWSAADFYPYLDVIFENFGVERIVFGSDWPVILAAGIYVQWKSLLEKYMEHFKEEEKELVFRQNAINFYHL